MKTEEEPAEGVATAPKKLTSVPKRKKEMREPTEALGSGEVAVQGSSEIAGLASQGELPKGNSTKFSTLERLMLIA